MNIVISGIQGSGKGTHARKICEKFGYLQFETGVELKKLAKEDSDLGRKIHRIIYVEGGLVDDSIVAEVLRDFIAKNKGVKIIFDGVPRNMTQKPMFDGEVSEYIVLFLELSREEVLRRLAGRRVCPVTWESFSPDFPLDHNPKNGEKLIVRADDTPEVIEKRIATFERDTLPLLETWKGEGRHVHIIDSKGSPEETFALIEAAVQQYV